ncbi:DUF4244 domain-containing protein [Nesterenkonia sp. CF4.4]|uniref:DUF4244 domain-containing protein n=1 Tax=Nesterenkonia sp. CF4.4 TaxID=3373079 RepID=UPI003EE818A8
MERMVMEGIVTARIIKGKTPTRTAPKKSDHLAQQIHQEEAGLATAEYGIVMLAAVGFAGLLVAVLSSSTAQAMLTGVVERALSF